APAAAPAAAAPAHPNAAVPFGAPIARPLFSLANAAPGEHVLTINVAPENLGPVTVRAHVSGEHLRVELFAPGDAGREALRGILPELRRDLAGQGLHTTLDLSSQDRPGDQRGGVAPEAGGQPGSGGGNAGRPETRPAGTAPDNARLPAADTVRPRPSASASTIDVMA
ncbi:flagellar hook-length control protein FliK, partial [Arthrobacter sp. GCM10027362]|uniref:flagellar hook-length control protein FliK n=1 Tax=Arthrobacter sp. GCM10027362 TaxID=3273379 RepID=UPI003630F6D2